MDKQERLKKQMEEQRLLIKYIDARRENDEAAGNEVMEEVEELMGPQNGNPEEMSILEAIAATVAAHELGDEVRRNLLCCKN